MKRFAFLFFLLTISLRPSLAQTRADCLTCHADESLSTERNGKEISLFVNEQILNNSTHRKLACVACHVGFDPENIPHKEKIEPVNCMTCHSNPVIKHGFHPQMNRASGRDGTADVSCKSCHGKHDVASPRKAGTRFSRENLPVACGQCHSSEKETYLQSAHAKALAGGVRGAPDCLTCHRNSITNKHGRADDASLKTAQEKVCLSCHLDDPEIRSRTTHTAGFIAAYEKSVHGKALLSGNGKAANCVNCHGSHTVKGVLDPSARINKIHIPETCSQCHTQIGKEYTESVHGEALARGVKDAPVCTDCHGEHTILSPDDPRSPVAPLNVSGQVCSPCHSSLRLSQKYGIASDRYKTFSDSYHGLAIKAGAVEVANCASCHGVHTIKRASDPASSVHPANIATTCGKCHPGANERFAVGSVHTAVGRQDEPVLYWIATLYVILIVSLIGSMFVHNLLDFYRKAKRKLLIRRGVLMEEHVGHGLYLRMTLSERVQHGTLMVSFTLLVLTGFMLRYPEAWWVVAIRSLSHSMFDLRSLIHRIAAVVMIAASIYHLFYIIFTERGKKLIRDLLPTLQDARDAIAVLKYNLGIAKTKPRFGRFSYIEKSEYWALVWGTIIMAATGFIMWFDNTFMGLFGKLGWDVARTIHFYEAWLATLAIIVWHLYYVIFNPDVYPMNLAWLTGYLTEQEMAEEHPLELEKIKREEMRKELREVPTEHGKTEAHSVETTPRKSARGKD